MRAVVLGLLWWAFAAATPPNQPKHILMLVIDDFGFADASYKAEMYNGTNPPPTPHIDDLAKSGVRLEDYHVNKLCSPTRTALLSGRYAYTNGMDDGVIIDGQDRDLPLNLMTIADHLQQGGWNTSAYGKWDAGMTVWGSTPTCRGFDHFHGFYSAASDYFTHMVGPGFDYHNDFKPDPTVEGVYTTHAVTRAVEGWIEKQISGQPNAKTFAYVAHEGVHGPLEVPLDYINDECRRIIPADHPIRLIYCGMVRAVDESIRNITETYKRLGIWNDTLFILTADNGGMPEDGGNNFPLRGNKATLFQGGVQGLGFVAGAGLEEKVKGTISKGLMHVTDWLPTLVGGVAGLPVTDTGRKCPTCTRKVTPLDGVNQWSMLSQGGSSARTEVLLDLQATACVRGQGTPCNIPGSGAIRVGKWKLIHGHAGVFGASAAGCEARQPKVPGKSALPVTKTTTNPWCPYGWTPPARSDGKYELPLPPPEIGCTTLPCILPANSPYVSGGDLLFDLETDPFEEHNVASQHPDIVTQLLGKLNAFNHTHCGGQRCEPDDAGGPRGKPTKVPGMQHLQWLPWRGNPNPATCDTNRTGPPGSHVISHLDAPSVLKSPVSISGWCWDSSFPGGGIPPMYVRGTVDQEVVVQHHIANLTRPKLMNATGAPNNEHGFRFTLTPAQAAKLMGKGLHRLDVEALLDPHPTSSTPRSPLSGSPACYKDATEVKC